jgi:hypothetical protein
MGQRRLDKTAALEQAYNRLFWNSRIFTNHRQAGRQGQSGHDSQTVAHRGPQHRPFLAS